jgi:parvulin-like peptidyl-prolyl isomerase
VLCAACAGGAPQAVRGSSTAPAAHQADRKTSPIEPVQQDPQAVPVGDLGPEILLPRADEPDAEVARVGDLVLRKSHAYTRLLSAHPKLALSAVDLLVTDVLVARHAEQHGIRVSEERVEQLAAEEEQQVREQVATELGSQMDLETYVWRIFGMRLADWQRTAELRIAQRLYQGYVIRYLALREDRVVVRYIVHKDRTVLEDAAQKVREGADFATLARRLSEDPLRRDGGLLPPFGSGFPHPVAEQALQLKPGQLSPVFERSSGGASRHYLVYCLRQLPGRSVTFDEVRDEIDRELEQKPLSPIETNAYTLRWRGAVEAITDDNPKPPR